MSPTQLIQVLSPYGLEKHEAGQTIDIRWRSAGLNAEEIETDYQDVVLETPRSLLAFGRRHGTTAADASLDGRTGTYEGGVTLGAAGALPGSSNTAASFDGSNDSVSVGNHASLQPTQPTRISLEAWIKPDVDASGYRFVLGKNSGNQDGYGLFQQSGGEIRFFVNGYDNNALTAAVEKGNGRTLSGAYDGAMMRLYVNGVEVASKVYTTAIVPSNSSLFIGSMRGRLLLLEGLSG